MAETAAPEEDDVQLDKRGLPPIGRIKMPDGIKVVSTKIRWLSSVGYLPNEISKYLGCRYQQVRNVLQNPPKRAAREDLPPPTVEILRLSDDMLEVADEEHLRQQMAAQRLEHRAERKSTNRERRRLREEAQALGEDDFGNEAVDDEGYGER
jgi:hypothetical protein